MENKTLSIDIGYTTDEGAYIIDKDSILNYYEASYYANKPDEIYDYWVDANADYLDGLFTDRETDSTVSLSTYDDYNGKYVYYFIDYNLGTIEFTSQNPDYPYNEDTVTWDIVSTKETGDASNNSLYGTIRGDTLEGFGGDDTYYINNAGDRVLEKAGEGNDTVRASVSFTLAAGQSVEILRLTGSASLDLTGNGIANTLYDNAGNNRLDGGGGVDLIYSGGGVDTLIGGAGADSAVIDRSGATVALSFVMQSVGGTTTLVGDGTTTNGIGNITLTGGAGNDRFTTLDGTDVLSGGAGNDTITAGASNDVLNGGIGNDTLNGGTGIDRMTGGAGNDTYLVDTSADLVFEAKGGGSDRVFLTSTFYLGNGQEVEALQLLSSTGTAKLNVAGNTFGQTLVGNAGANALDGKGGADVLTGNKGADTFVFSTALGTSNVDRITDFATEDTIRLSKSVFAAIAPGQLAESAFKNISTGVADGNDRILYKQVTGELFYDADGSGAGAAVKFAVLDNHAKVTHADFLIA